MFVTCISAVLAKVSRRGSRPWRKWLDPRSGFFHLGIFCINLFEDIRLNILRYSLYSYNNKNLGNFMSYFFLKHNKYWFIRNKSCHIVPNFTHKNRDRLQNWGKLQKYIPCLIP